ncbi:unnamed protein product [Pleuronectes platessa]|uniref:Uncharacterized protein n=1 Tax=Pleuronectes platessa TaxID=8262 RepID=A0A9N7YIF3_PLEPL|nr:unnamed protein product [Pleuronectes platessa]
MGNESLLHFICYMFYNSSTGVIGAVSGAHCSAPKTTLTCKQPWISLLPRSPLTESPVLRKVAVFQLHHIGPRPGPRLPRLFFAVNSSSTSSLVSAQQQHHDDLL